MNTLQQLAQEAANKIVYGHEFMNEPQVASIIRDTFAPYFKVEDKEDSVSGASAHSTSVIPKSNSLTDYQRGMITAAEIAARHSHTDEPEADPFCQHYGCRNGIAEEIKAVVFTGLDKTDERVCVNCNHAGFVNAHGICCKNFAVIPSTGTWKDTHCGCKCVFPEETQGSGFSVCGEEGQ